MGDWLARRPASEESPLDPIIVLSVVMLAVWAAGTWFDGPGWIHLLLTAGVFLLVWRIATRAERAHGPGGPGRADRR
ncbi:MAG: hypothetical protein U9Q74_12675 [Gemmatimonadota bacterium]|nr:hypothetical protein [Gemmatimonadota bacterium]